MSDAQLVPPALADAIVEAAYREIGALHRGATIGFGIATGRIIVERFFGGDMATFRARGAGDASLRKLAALLDDDRTPGLTSAGLYRAVEFYDLDLRVGISGRNQLTAAHVRAVIGLPQAHQERLLGRAEAKDWTAAQLEREALKVRKPIRPGRRPNPAFVNSLNRMRRLATSDDAFGDLDAIATLGDADAEEVRAAMAAIRARCDAIEGALGERVRP